MAVPERRGLSKPPSIKARRAEVAPGGFNWPELGREEIPAALRMILPCLRLRSPLGLVASRGHRRPASRGWASVWARDGPEK